MFTIVTLMIDILPQVVTPLYKYEPLEIERHFRGAKN